MVKEFQKSFSGENLSKEEEINLIYDGPSFDGKMELNKLTSQLKSTELILQETITTLHKEKKLRNPENTKVYLELKRSSFKEIISIIFNHPLSVFIVGSIIVEVFKKYANKKKGKKDEKTIENNFVNNKIIVNNLNMMVNPLQDKRDKLIIRIPNREDTEIYFQDKEVIQKNVSRFKKETKVLNYYEDEFTGFLNSINVRQKRYGFILEGTKNNYIIPVTFDEGIDLEEIAKILPEKIRIKARVEEEDGDVKRMHILNHKIIKKKTLSEY